MLGDQRLVLAPAGDPGWPGALKDRQPISSRVLGVCSQVTVWVSSCHLQVPGIGLCVRQATSTPFPTSVVPLSLLFVARCSVVRVDSSDSVCWEALLWAS